MGKVTDNTVIRIFLTAFGDVSGTWRTWLVLAMLPESMILT